MENGKFCGLKLKTWGRGLRPQGSRSAPEHQDLISLHTRGVVDTICDAKLDLVRGDVVKITHNGVFCVGPTQNALPPSPQKKLGLLMEDLGLQI